MMGSGAVKLSHPLPSTTLLAPHTHRFMRAVSPAKSDCDKDAMLLDPRWLSMSSSNGSLRATRGKHAKWACRKHSMFQLEGATTGMTHMYSRDEGRGCGTAVSPALEQCRDFGHVRPMLTASSSSSCGDLA